MPQAVTITSLPRAFELVKGMQGQGLEWGESYRALGRRAIAAILSGQMGQAIDEHLDRMAELDQADRRNGLYRRHLLTELGEIELAVPRTCRFEPITVVRAYARRAAQLDRMILACFVLGLSVRKVGEALLPILGRPISPTTVSTVAKQLDAVVAAFHARALKERYRVLMLDGVVLARKTGAGAVRRPVLVALGLRRDGKKEIVDFLPDWTLAPLVAALQTMRGMALVNAATLIAELGDLSRFANPRQLMAYLGLVPSEHSSGTSVRRGRLTKAGNSAARRLLIEAAWCYRFPARVSRELLLRQEALPKAIREIAWKAQTRLCARFRKLARTGKPANVVTAAIARELAGFVWAIARQVPPSAAAS